MPVQLARLYVHLCIIQLPLTKGVLVWFAYQAAGGMMKDLHCCWEERESRAFIHHPWPFTDMQLQALCQTGLYIFLLCCVYELSFRTSGTYSVVTSI